MARDQSTATDPTTETGNETDEIVPDVQAIETATDRLRSLEDRLEDVNHLDELSDDVRRSVLDDLDAIVDVAADLDELLETIDVTDLPEAIDVTELVSAIEMGSIPNALRSGDLDDAVDLQRLVAAIDLVNAWKATDFTAFMDQKRELEETVEEIDSETDDGIVDATVDAVTDADTDEFDLQASAGIDDVGNGDGLFTGGGDNEIGIGVEDVADNPTMYQEFIQQQAIEGIDALRAGLLEAHERFERLYEWNRDRMRRQDTSTNSRNPTAVSTMTTERPALHTGATYSTVPQDVRHSTAPSRRRIYGRRFELEREKRREEDG